MIGFKLRDVTHFLGSGPEKHHLLDLKASRRPELYAGDEPGFDMTRKVSEALGKWRLHRIDPPGRKSAGRQKVDRPKD